MTRLEIHWRIHPDFSKGFSKNVMNHWWFSVNSFQISSIVFFKDSSRIPPEMAPWIPPRIPLIFFSGFPQQLFYNLLLNFLQGFLQFFFSRIPPRASSRISGRNLARISIKKKQQNFRNVSYDLSMNFLKDASKSSTKDFYVKYSKKIFSRILKETIKMSAT